MELNASAGSALIIRKDGTKEAFNPEKIKTAIRKSAARVKENIITDEEQNRVCELVINGLPKDKDVVTVPEIHHLVEAALDEVRPDVAKSYRDYRNYKHDFVYMMDDILTESQKIRYIGDKDNANCDSALVSTKRSLIYKKFSKETYKKFFLHPEEKKANDEGYIYIHD